MAEPRANYVEPFKGKDGQWYFRQRDGGNHKIISTSEGYTRRSGAIEGARNAHPGLDIIEDGEHIG